jgi:hypothetical protein
MSRPCLEAGRALRDVGQVLELREEVGVIQEVAFDGAVDLSQLQNELWPHQVEGRIVERDSPVAGEVFFSRTCTLFAATFMRDSFVEPTLRLRSMGRPSSPAIVLCIVCTAGPHASWGIVGPQRFALRCGHARTGVPSSMPRTRPTRLQV